MDDLPSLVLDASRENATSSSTNSSHHALIHSKAPAHYSSSRGGAQEDLWRDGAVGGGSEQRASSSIYGELKVKDCLGFLGPGFLITIAYVDPGNFEVDMQAGAQFGSSLLWVLLIATLAGLLVQILCVRLAVTTGKHLSQMCRNEYTPMQSKGKKKNPTEKIDGWSEISVLGLHSSRRERERERERERFITYNFYLVWFLYIVLCDMLMK